MTEDQGTPRGPSLSFVSSSESDTLRLGRALGGVLRKGDVVFTEGPLGVGKTCLIRGICAGLGFDGRVRSPSFAVVNQYAGRCGIYHVDLYRIPADSPELEDLSRQEYFSDEVVTLVEWGEKLASWGVKPALNVKMRIGESERRLIDVEAAAPELGRRVRALGPETARVDERKEERGITTGRIDFQNGNAARYVRVSPGTAPAATLDALGIGVPKALVVVTGGAEELEGHLIPRLTRLFTEGIAATAAGVGALIVDGGTEAGVMALMGRGVADRGRKTTLLGVAPAGKATYPGGPVDGSVEGGAPLDPNHSHFVMVECDEWGCETETMSVLVSFIGSQAPSMAILVNGGETTRSEVVRYKADGLEIVVIRGSGRLADEIASAREGRGAADPEISAVAEYDKLTLFDIGAGPDAMSALMREKLKP
jgi:tRNA threonylcarbamoyl adenosine modification protein YjeE